LDGQGVIIGTTSPPTASVNSPTLYINSVTGQQYTNTGSSTWQLLPASGLDSGTLNFATLHWDGSAWVENKALTAGATNTAVNVSNNISLTADNAITLTAGKVIALTTTASLGAMLLDNQDSVGLDGQVLTSTGTRTLWKSIAATGLASGTQDFSTLHWGGEAWVENKALTAGATNTTVQVNNNITMSADNTIALTSTNTTVNASNKINLSADNTISLTATTTISGGSITLDATEGGNVAIRADKNTDISATETVTLAAGKVIALTTTASLDGALLDSKGNPGKNGQVLASTSTLTTWITIAGNTVTETTTNYNASVDDGTIVVLPVAPVTISLPAIEASDTGKIMTIKRGNEYTINSSGAPVNPLQLVTSGGSTIDGTSSLKLNLSYQGYTLQALAGNWVIIQRF